MKITSVNILACKRPSDTFSAASLRSDDFSGFQFIVVTMTTDTGLSASMFGFAGRSAEGVAKLAADSMRAFFIGRDPLEREKAWHDFRMADRWWGHLPIYAYGPFDTCLWLLSAQAAGQPLYKYIGAYRDHVPTYGSSMVLDSVEAYGNEAARAKAEGLKAYKLHPAGKDLTLDMEAHRYVREVVGPDFTLMSDPVSSMNLEQAIRFGRELERLDYHWFEEPLFDEDMHALRELTRVLDIPVVGTEYLAKHPYSVADVISRRVVDRVRADVSWTGGVTGVLKTARTAESFGVNCELHTCIFHPLDLANMHCAAAVRNCDFFELLYPIDAFAFGLAEPLPIENGMAVLPEKPGLGIELDWDDIDRCTVATF